MDDLTSKINEIMSDPEKLREIQNLGKMMGITGNDSKSQNPVNTPQGANQQNSHSGMGNMNHIGNNGNTVNVGNMGNMSNMGTGGNRSSFNNGSNNQNANQNPNYNNGNNFNSGGNNYSGNGNNQGGFNNSQMNGNPLGALSGIDPSVIGKLAPILASFNKEDETTRLFDALCPFLSAERQEKLQKIRKMMVIIKLLPNIKNLGLF